MNRPGNLLLLPTYLIILFVMPVNSNCTSPLLIPSSFLNTSRIHFEEDVLKFQLNIYSGSRLCSACIFIQCIYQRFIKFIEFLELNALLLQYFAIKSKFMLGVFVCFNRIFFHNVNF